MCVERQTETEVENLNSNFLMLKDSGTRREKERERKRERRICFQHSISQSGYHCSSSGKALTSTFPASVSPT